MNFSEYIKLIFEARQPSQNVKAAMEMSDDDLTNYLEELFPDGTIAVALELRKTEFKKVQKNFRTIDHSHKQFKIDLSGVEFMFLLNESSTDDVDNS